MDLEEAREEYNRLSWKHGGDLKIKAAVLYLSALETENAQLRAKLDKLRCVDIDAAESGMDRLRDELEAMERCVEIARKSEEKAWRLHQELFDQSADATHVVSRIVNSHEDLDACGCDQCERVREGMTEAGFLEPRTTDGRSGE